LIVFTGPLGGDDILFFQARHGPLSLVLLFVAYPLATAGLSFAVGTRIQNPSQASGLSLLFSLTLAPLGGAWWPIQITPPFMQTLGRISPVAWLMDGSTTLAFKGGRLADIPLPLSGRLISRLIEYGIPILEDRHHGMDRRP